MRSPEAQLLAAWPLRRYVDVYRKGEVRYVWPLPAEVRRRRLTSVCASQVGGVLVLDVRQTVGEALSALTRRKVGPPLDSPLSTKTL